jgi:hypothetical protein
MVQPTVLLVNTRSLMSRTAVALAADRVNVRRQAGPRGDPEQLLHVARRNLGVAAPRHRVMKPGRLGDMIGRSGPVLRVVVGRLEEDAELAS